VTAGMRRALWRTREGGALRLGGTTGAEGAAALVLAWAVLAPLVLLLAGSVTRASAWRTLVSPAGQTVREATLTSVVVSVVSALLSTALGAAVAGWIARRRFPMRGLAELACLLPLALPPIVGVMAFLFLWGDVGLLHGVLRAWLHVESFPRLSGVLAVLVVHVYSFAPLAYLLLRDAFAAVDGELDMAARCAGAGRWTRARMAWWPQLRAAMWSAAWLTFMSSMASFSAPYLVGGGARFLSTEIVARGLAGDHAMAELETVVLAGISLLLLVVRPGVSAGRARRGLLPVRPRGRAAAGHTALALAVLLAAALPHLTLWLLSLVRDGTWTSQPLPPSFTLANHRGLLSQAQSLRPLTHSALMALPATVIGAAWAWLVGRASALGPVRLRPLADLAALVPWAVPATALAVSWIAAYNRPTAAGFGLVLASTPWLLPWAYVLRFVPLQIRAVASALQSRGAALEAVARTLGASPWRAALAVTLPVVRPALLAASAVVFVSAMGEFVVSVLLYVPENRPVSLEILSQLRVFNLGQAAALGCWLSLLLTIVLAIAPKAADPWTDARGISVR
jgi:iron(III) transport system permease protein